MVKKICMYCSHWRGIAEDEYEKCYVNRDPEHGFLLRTRFDETCDKFELHTEDYVLKQKIPTFFDL